MHPFVQVCVNWNPFPAALQVSRSFPLHCVSVFAVQLVVLCSVTVSPNQDSSTLKGTTAYKGKVQGKVCIVHDPSKADHFEENNILVTGMTRPEYLHLMKKSSAIVTDAGGILSHAAIVARELKKPCVIGTNMATKVLKDGMKVEVDANKGIIKIL